MFQSENKEIMFQVFYIKVGFKESHLHGYVILTKNTHNSRPIGLETVFLIANEPRHEKTNILVSDLV